MIKKVRFKKWGERWKN